MKQVRIFSDLVPNAFTQAEFDVCDRVRETYETLIQVPCTGCSYCQPCPQNVRIPYIMTQYNRVTMFDAMEDSKKLYDDTVASGRGADQCVQCGLCEPKCPQNIPIIEKLQEIHRFFNR